MGQKVVTSNPRHTHNGYLVPPRHLLALHTEITFNIAWGAFPKCSKKHYQIYQLRQTMLSNALFDTKNSYCLRFNSQLPETQLVHSLHVARDARAAIYILSERLASKHRRKNDWSAPLHEPPPTKRARHVDGGKPCRWKKANGSERL